MKVEITKLYLIQVFDENGNEVACEYQVCDRATALKIGKELKSYVKEKQEG